MERDKQIRAALEMLSYSYAPYSHFRVGAALVTRDGELYTGCNIENSVYGLTICAERTAFFKAISEGKREFESIVIVGGTEDLESVYGADVSAFCPPCGSCRQLMREFCNPKEFHVILATLSESREYALEELLPESFGPEFL